MPQLRNQELTAMACPHCVVVAGSPSVRQSLEREMAARITAAPPNQTWICGFTQWVSTMWSAGNLEELYLKERTAIIGLLGTVIILGTIFALLLGRGGHEFRPSLASRHGRRRPTANLRAVLGVVALASLIFDLAGSPIGRIPHVAPILAGTAVILIIGMVILRNFTDLIMGLLSVGALVFAVGIAGAVELGVLVVLMLWLLGAIRGLSS